MKESDALEAKLEKFNVAIEKRCIKAGDKRSWSRLRQKPLVSALRSSDDQVLHSDVDNAELLSSTFSGYFMSSDAENRFLPVLPEFPEMVHRLCLVS